MDIFFFALAVGVFAGYLIWEFHTKPMDYLRRENDFVWNLLDDHTMSSYSDIERGASPQYNYDEPFDQEKS